MKQSDIIEAARASGVVIGHDGAMLPDPRDLIEPEDECPCNGTGQVPVYFGSVLLEMVACPRGCEA